MFYGGRDIRVEEIPDPEPGPGEVLIRVRAAGICGSDLHNYRGNRSPAGDVPWRQGHELAGEVAGVGSGVTGLETGQRVALEAEHLIGCGVCRECRAGRYHICPARGMRDGERHASHGFSEFDVCIAENVRPIPDHVSMDAAALLDCYAVDVHAIHQAPVSPDDTVVILGAGAIALTLGQVAKAFGAGRIIMVGTRRQPLDVALSAGAADEVAVTTGSDPLDAVLDLTDGEGASIVYETVGGNAQLLDLSVQMARRGGTVCVIGLFTSPQTLDAATGMQKELSIVWSNSFSTWNGVSEHATALSLVSGNSVDPAPIVTHHFPLDSIAEAFQAADDKRSSGVIRAVIEP